MGQNDTNALKVGTSGGAQIQDEYSDKDREYPVGESL
jgi:hypothetical protein